MEDVPFPAASILISGAGDLPPEAPGLPHHLSGESFPAIVITDGAHCHGGLLKWRRRPWQLWFGLLSEVQGDEGSCSETF